MLKKITKEISLTD